MNAKKVIVIFFIRLLITYDLLAVTAPFTDDMENGTNGWTLSAGNNDWTGGPNTPSGPGNPPSFTAPPPLVHPSWNKCWGTNLTGNYTKNRNSRLISPQISLGLTPPKPFLSVYLWYKTDVGDFAYVEVRTYGSPTWDTPPLETISPGSNSNTVPGNINGWIKRTYNLTGYTGDIQVGFRLSSNNDNKVALGLYVDDVAVGLNYDTEDRYIIALEPEPTPVSTTATTNNMTVRVEVRDLYEYVDTSINGTVNMQVAESNPNNSWQGATSASLTSGKATFTFTDKEREEVTFTPSFSISGSPLTSVSATGEFRSSFRSAWEEQE